MFMSCWLKTCTISRTILKRNIIDSRIIFVINKARNVSLNCFKKIRDPGGGVARGVSYNGDLLLAHIHV